MEGAKIRVNGARHHYRQTYNKLRKSKAFKSDGLVASERVITVPLTHTKNPEIMYTVLTEVLNAMEIEYEIEKY